ncbi:C1 family peptidase [Mycobacterium vicinigordonae]|uniref:C1 family peptidase n=1 Tax=Mycobacterium vicinigordonae TaxID=1719132 RepID=A0A7D6DX32_9MYCO|nr:C1 family peptidase [Mycobacterium vicinigordonae]QLL06944.1 C1 family peptidase [Mycobacterium vicinigordonae]
MEPRFGRRSMLALAAATAAAAALPGCGTATQDDEPVELTAYGYDPDVPEPGTPERPERRGQLPAKASVRTEWLPPVGRQTMPNCFVWATVYGLATFYAARKSKTAPTTPARRAGPDYAYIRYQQANQRAENTCEGGQIVKCLNWLRDNGGTPSLQAAPNRGRQKANSSCAANWADYGSQTIAPDPMFCIPEHKTTRITGPSGLDNLRTVIANGMPIAFGVWLYSDFPHYRANPSPYVGNGQWMHDNAGKKVGHVMLITGYDDHLSAVRVQNSFGKRWGERGFVSIAYDTLEKMSQGIGVYVPDTV